MKDISIDDFLKNLGNKTPTPGGGAVSALNGAIASAQLKMVCEYTKDENINDKTSFLTEKVETFLSLAEADSEAFIAVSEAYKSKDKVNIDQALIKAAAVSMKIVDECGQILDFYTQNLAGFNKRLSADLIVVLANIQASVESARAMEVTNLDSLSDAKPEDILTSVNTAEELLKLSQKLMVKTEAKT